MALTFQWRGDFENAEVSALHAEAFNGNQVEHHWNSQVQACSLGWVCARDEAELVGFVNVPWDGASHAFILDTMVAPQHGRRGVGTQLVAIAAAEARAAGCAWLHVDFEDHLRAFYIDACGFTPTDAGLIALEPSE